MSYLPVEAAKFSPFLLFLPQTPSQKNLILVPSPIAITTSSYRTLYRSVHASPEFCMMGFGPSWPPKNWSDKETGAWMRRCDVDKSWGPRGMGDFAIGLLPGKIENAGREAGKSGLRILKEGEWKSFMEARGGEGLFLEGLEYVGYAGIRDATTTSLVSVGPPEIFPSYSEMIELRYGIAPEHWGRGLARSAAEGVMEWGVFERGVRRYIAETEKTNVRSGRVLEKMGFQKLSTSYFQNESEFEWGLDAARFLDQRKGKEPSEG